MKRSIRVAIAILAFSLLCWTLFGSFHATEVIGQQCGPEAVTPCVMHDVTREVDILDKYRLYAATVAGTLCVVSLVLVIAIKERPARKT